MELSAIAEIVVKALAVVAALVVLRFVIVAIGKSQSWDKPDERWQQLEARITALEAQVRELQADKERP